MIEGTRACAFCYLFVCCNPNFVISLFSNKHEELRVVRVKVPLVLESQRYMKVRD